jgi:hypothetical protein
VISACFHRWTCTVVGSLVEPGSNLSIVGSAARRISSSESLQWACDQSRCQ